MTNVIPNCLNCAMDGKQCYECYILSGDEDRDIAKAAKLCSSPAQPIMTDEQRLDAAIKLARDCENLSTKEITKSYWKGYAEGLENLRQDCLDAQREAWEAHGEKRMGA